jgi:hypothetical protein
MAIGVLINPDRLKDTDWTIFPCAVGQTTGQRFVVDVVIHITSIHQT